MAEFQSTPASQLYGVFGTQAAAAMAAGGPGSYAALLKKARDEQVAYAQALAQSQQAELAYSADNNAADVAKAYLPAAAGLVDKGVGHFIHPADNPYLHFDNQGVAQADAVSLEARRMGAIKDYGASVKDIEGATGYIPSIQAVEANMRGPLAPPEYIPFISQAAPTGNQIEKQKADARTTEAAAETVRAAKYDGKSGGGGSDDAYTITENYDEDGELIGTTHRRKGHGAIDKPQGGGGGDNDGKVAVLMKSGAQKGKVRRVPPSMAQGLIRNGLAEQVK